MKFPSLLKTPANKRFSIEPRYYDPIKEDIENRTDRIKKMLEAREAEEASGHTSRIQGSFSRYSQHRNTKTGALRFAIMLFLSMGLLGYWFFGELALYTIMVIALGSYLFKRLRDRTT